MRGRLVEAVDSRTSSLFLTGFLGEAGVGTVLGPRTERLWTTGSGLGTEGRFLV